MVRLTVQDIQIRFNIAASLAHAIAANGHFGESSGKPQKYDADTVTAYMTERTKRQRRGEDDAGQ